MSKQYFVVIGIRNGVPEYTYGPYNNSLEARIAMNELKRDYARVVGLVWHVSAVFYTGGY